MNENIKLIKEIISLLDKKIKKTTDNQNLEYIRSKYVTALNNLEKEESLSVDLRGLDRLYLESYSDYMNPLLDKMYELNMKIYG